MRIPTVHLTFAVLCGLLSATGISDGQYHYDYGEPDTTKQDTAKRQIEQAEQAVSPADSTKDVLNGAVTWTRRLLLRGFPDFATTGTWVTYAETAWNRATGSYGPVQAHLTVNYLGSTNWMGAEAGHLQIVYRTLDTPKITVDLDVVVDTGERITVFHRVLYRVDRGELLPTTFQLPDGVLDYDLMDQPRASGQTELELYSGVYEASIYEGTGTNAAYVAAYRVEDLPPLGLVLLGYGDEALTYKSGGDGAEPRFVAPTPTAR